MSQTIAYLFLLVIYLSLKTYILHNAMACCASDDRSHSFVHIFVSFLFVLDLTSYGIRTFVGKQTKENIRYFQSLSKKLKDRNLINRINGKI